MYIKRLRITANYVEITISLRLKKGKIWCGASEMKSEKNGCVVNNRIGYLWTITIISCTKAFTVFSNQQLFSKWSNADTHEHNLSIFCCGVMYLFVTNCPLIKHNVNRKLATEQGKQLNRDQFYSEQATVRTTNGILKTIHSCYLWRDVTKTKYCGKSFSKLGRKALKRLFRL